MANFTLVKGASLAEINSKVADAQAAQAGAEAARDAAFVNADIYADTAAGLAATAEGDQFQVLSGDEFIRYRHDTGDVATEVGRFPTAAAVAAIDSYPKNGLDAIKRAASQVMDVVWYGNSHVVKDGKGLRKALAARLAQQFGGWATPIDVYFNQSGIGASGWSADLGKFVIDTFPAAYVANGATLAGSWTSGATFLAPGTIVDNAAATRSFVDPTHNLRVHYQYAGFAAGAGSFKIGMRQQESPWTPIFTSDAISTVSAAGDTMLMGHYDLAASAGRTGYYGVMINPSGQTITGPFMATMLRVEDRDATHGVSFNTGFTAGGYSLYYIVTSVLAKDDNAEINYFAELRRLQIARGQTPNIVIGCNEGHNQRNETLQPSLGRRAITDSDGPLALLDNFEALQRHIDDLWRSQGWDVREVTYLFWVDHPPQGGDDAEMTGYRQIMTTLGAALPRTSVVDSAALVSEAELSSTSSYIDGLHLVNTLGAGYDLLAQRFVASL
ncbi:hypothetical protein [Paenirhodobacter sp. CAU 1674]|uniref:hypothetical protein n=1 Tax=Paenirhodobacter sp. CAU 1674 TaxID=3032596 RepID=UPI0023D9B290|nr:hypothetical protein [Paenirhodobacter sp. CAU 1674]MDF2140868.1 hypothetical protein [Paenirhodobacter sp. CAU 1674]